jgi:hypothetical protein
MDDESFGSALAIAYDLHRVVYVPSWCERNPQRSPEAISLPRRIRRSYRWCSEAKIRAERIWRHALFLAKRPACFRPPGWYCRIRPPNLRECPQKEHNGEDNRPLHTDASFPEFLESRPLAQGGADTAKNAAPAFRPDGARLLLQIESATLDQSAGRSPRSSSFSLLAQNHDTRRASTIDSQRSACDPRLRA